MVLAPTLALGWLLVALALAVQLAALPAVVRRAWPVVLLLTAAGPALYGAGVVLIDGRPAVVAGVAAAVFAVGLGAVPAARALPAGARSGVLVAAALPGLAAPVAGHGPVSVGAGLLLAAALGGLAVLSPGRAVPVTAEVVAVVALVEATVSGLDGSAVTLAVLGQALVAAVLGTVLRSRFATVTGLVLGGLGTLVAIGRDAPLVALLRPGAPYVVDGLAQVPAIAAGAAASLLVLAGATALLTACGRLGWVRPEAGGAAVWTPLGLAGLYGAAGLVLAPAMLVAPTSGGFTAAHALVSVSWTVAALVLLARGLHRAALRVAGLVLMAAAVAKLLLFDLVALDGLARVLAFLGAGLVLLAAGTWYARRVAEAQDEAPPNG